jgi:hypothetical protein
MTRLSVSPAIALALLIAAGGSAIGEEPLGLADIMSRLDLTHEAVMPVEPVIADSLQTRAAIKRNAFFNGERVVGEQLARERQRRRAELNGVLNAAQLEEWDRIQDELDADVLTEVRP